MHVLWRPRVRRQETAGCPAAKQFALDTHDFESRYLDGLIGPLPDAEALYDSRAPLNNVHKLSTPVLLEPVGVPRLALAGS